jgi:hypothetical protein
MIIASPSIAAQETKSYRPRPKRDLDRQRTEYATRRELMGVAAITTVCTRELIHELRDFLPSARVAFPDVPIVVWTDVEDYQTDVGNVDIRYFDPSALKMRTGNVAAHADYWHPEAIHQKIVGLRQVVSEYEGQDGVLLVDCDITFRLGFERRFHGDVALSPFYWGDRGIKLRVANDQLLQHRDGEFNAGMLVTRSLAFCDWWLGAYESGEGGFYEQGCLDMVPARFVTDFISPAHNYGKWRFVEPHTEVRSFHQHSAEPSRKYSVGALKIAAQRAGAEARAKLAAELAAKETKRRTINDLTH